MDPTIIALLSLRIVGQVTGNEKVAGGIETLIGAYNAGQNIDRHMAGIAGKLEAGTLLDTWDDIQARIDAEVDSFLDTAGANPGTEDEPGLLADEQPDDPPAAA